MKRTDLENKKIFLIATSIPERAPHLLALIQKYITNATVFSAADGNETLFKIQNFPPHLVIVDVDLPKLDGIALTEQILLLHKASNIAVILISELPDNEHFVEEVITTQVQFLTDVNNEQMVSNCINRALNRISSNENAPYHLRFLTADEILFSEGDKANSVFIVKKGELSAIKNYSTNPTLLGTVAVGEFVGEMAHINNEPRSATVKAVTSCELIEIPHSSLDTVLFSKPNWAKALISTLSKRLKISNSNLAEKKE